MGSPLSASLTEGHYDMHETGEHELDELSQELQEVEWLGLPEPGGFQSQFGSRHVADHWTFEIALVIVGALLGVALYFWMT